MSAPASIPRRLVFRALADALGGQARHLDRIARGDRTRPGHGAPSASKADGRAGRAQRLRAQADTISAWVGTPERYRRAPVDAAVFGYLVALAYGHSEALGELREELTDLGRPGIIDGLMVEDIVQIADRI